MKHRSTLRAWLAAVSLIAASASAQAELVRLHFTLGGQVSAVVPTFAVLAPQGADFSASFGFDYDTSATTFGDGARWQTLSGQFQVGGLDITGLGLGYASQSASHTVIGTEDGVGAGYTDGQGTRYELDGFDFVMPVSGFTGTLAEVLALGAGDVGLLRLWGTTRMQTQGFGTAVGEVGLSAFSVAVQPLAVPEPGSFALVGLALAALAGAPRRTARQRAVPDWLDACTRHRVR